MAHTSVECDVERHDCCCEHVVDSLEAMPAAREERRSVALDKWHACPHHDITPLEILLDSLRRSEQ